MPGWWRRASTRSSRAHSPRSSRAPASSASFSNDPVGVELAGAAKNAAALAAGATEAQGLNAAGAAAGHIFAEVWRYADGLGARPESMIGLAGAGDLVATALARESRNRRAGELLAAGVPAAEIPEQIGQAVEALESVPLLATALESAGVAAPVTGALARLIAGEAPAQRLGRARARYRAAARALAQTAHAGVLATGLGVAFRAVGAVRRRVLSQAGPRYSDNAMRVRVLYRRDKDTWMATSPDVTSMDRRGRQLLGSKQAYRGWTALRVRARGSSIEHYVPAGVAAEAA